MKIRMAYIEEPPFYWTAEDGAVTGADIELADAVLRAIGMTAIEYVPTSFEEFRPGVLERRWDMNVPIFVTPERARHVAFSQPVWALGDGFLVHPGNPKTLTDYPALAARLGARLGVIAGQVQVASAKAAGVADGQLVVFRNQPEAIAALMAGEIDAFAATAIGCRRRRRQPRRGGRRARGKPRRKAPRRCLLVRQGEREPVERRELAVAPLSRLGRAPRPDGEVRHHARRDRRCVADRVMTMKHTHDYKVVDVFTTRPLAGNPVAVVFEADGLDTDAMQAIASWTNLSETAFVLNPTTPAADYRLRIFTPRSELPFAEHPTLGSAHAVLEAGRAILREGGRLVQECNIGLVEVTVEDGAEGRVLTFALPSARITPLSATDVVSWNSSSVAGWSPRRRPPW